MRTTEICAGALGHAINHAKMWPHALVGLFVMLMLLATGPAHAAEASGLMCTFAEGRTQSYEDGTFKATPAKPLTFAIEQIDLEAQKAKIRISPDALGKLSIVRAINANHFIEPVAEGFMNLTTVYDKNQSTGQYPAVHSRHFGFIGQPVVSQYTGTCVDKTP